MGTLLNRRRYMGGKVGIDYSKQYLTFEALEQGKFKFPKALDYSLDGGSTWVSLAANTYTPSLEEGDTIMWKGALTPQTTAGGSGIGHFDSTCEYNVSGNLMSLLYDSNFIGQDTVTANYTFNTLFYRNSVVDASNLVLAKVLSQGCYRSLFNGCSKLTHAPNISFKSAGDDTFLYSFQGCTSLISVPDITFESAGSTFGSTFSGCTSLVTTPKITGLSSASFGSTFKGCTSLVTISPITIPSILNNSFLSTFQDCTSLVNVIELPWTVKQNCYSSMFAGCTSLVKAPNLPSTSIIRNCYRSMFKDCTSLTTPPVIAATNAGGATSPFGNMFEGCTSLTTAPSIPTAGFGNSAFLAMFKGCTSLKTAPLLPQTTLNTSCYESMFEGCTSLITAPVLPATTLNKSNCYKKMFYGCSSLNYIKAMFTTAPSSTYTDDWVDGVAANGTFVKNSAATWENAFSVDEIPTGWTVQTASE